jgi:LysM repeat protein
MIEMNLSFFIKNFYKSSVITFRKHLVVVVVSIFFSGLFLSIGIINTNAAVMKEEPRIKQVISLEIQKGDTLWSIAKEHITDDYNSIDDYIQEIKASNGLTSDTIHEGAYLIVPYYTSINQ